MIWRPPRAAVALAERFDFLYAAVGVHPATAGVGGSWLDELRSLAARPRVKAIGEIGLDYYWKENPPREHQQQVFHKQLELAEELDLPVIVHDREAHHDCLEVVRAHPKVRGVYHCYSGSLEDAKVLVSLGWMISFTGTITYKNARKALEVVEWLPMDRIMIETDAPYLTPEPRRGERCDLPSSPDRRPCGPAQGAGDRRSPPGHPGKRQTVFQHSVRRYNRMETISYAYEGALYVNLTNRCDCACVFCLRHNGHKGSIYADDLWLDHEPTREEALADLLSRDFSRYRELVFCGFGEPMFRTDDICWLVDALKQAVPALPPVRINTNGHANLILGRDVTPDLKGRIDVLSISLNGSTAEEYCAVTHPRDGEAAWQAMLDFTRRAAGYVPTVVMTIVNKDKSPAEIAACRALAEGLGAALRIREYIPD